LVLILFLLNNKLPKRLKMQIIITVKIESMINKLNKNLKINALLNKFLLKKQEFSKKL